MALGVNGSRLKNERITLFVLLFGGYTVYMFNRHSLAYNIPNIKLTEKVDSESIGRVTSFLAFGYAIGKFVSGILVDVASPKQLFPLGLLVCGAVNLAFSFTTNNAQQCMLWLANGLFQGFGWPSCAKLLRRWYSPALFGTLWSLLSASMNVASSLGPYICNMLMDNFESWRVSMRIFGIIAFIAAAICFFSIHDSPREGGFDMDSYDIVDPILNRTAQVQKPKLFTALYRIAMSPFIYVLSFGFLSCLLCKGVISDWGSLYLITEKNATRPMAASFITAFEIGGVTGNVLSGAVTDWIKSRSTLRDTGHPRNLVMIPFIAILATCLVALCNYVEDMTNQYMITLTLAFVIGFTLYSLISVVGVTVVEVSSSDISGTSHAVAALFGNFGLILSGLPFTMLVGSYSWSSAFTFVETVLFIWFLFAMTSQYMQCKIGEVKRKTD